MTSGKSAGIRIIEFSAVVTLLSGITVLLRLAAVARGDLDLAFALVQVSNFGEILLSTGLLMAPALTFLGALVCLYFAVRAVRIAINEPTKDSVTRGFVWFFAFSFAFIVAGIFQTSGGSIVFIATITVFASVETLVFIFAARIQHWARAALWRLRRGDAKVTGTWSIVLMLIAALVLATLGGREVLRSFIPTDQAWSQAEVLSFTDRSPYIARVLSSDSEWTYAVLDEPRSLEIVPTSQIVDRSVCSADGSIEETTDRLWLANAFGRVALKITFCDEELVRRESIYDQTVPADAAP